MEQIVIYFIIMIIYCSHMDPIINSKLQIYIGSYSLVISGQHDSKPNEKKNPGLQKVEYWNWWYDKFQIYDSKLTMI